MTQAPGFAADYFDGLQSTRHRVQVVVRDGSLVVRGANVLREDAVADVRVEPRLASLPLRIALPGGAVLVAEADAVAAAMPLPGSAGLAHRLESHLGIVLGSIVGLMVVGWFGYHDGVPWLARRVAEHLPPAIESQIAVEGLKSLDSFVLKPSAMDAARQARLRAAFAALSANLGPAARNARLEFRNGGWIGPNAFALPGGIVVMTDQLASLLDDEHVAAVLAHELGHLQFRHGTRAMLQDSIVGLAGMALFGDATAVANVTATVPTALLHTGYSREFEREADGFAFGLLRATGRSPRLLGESLAALSKARPKRDRVAGGMDYVSTHPPTEERIRAAEEASR
ncbi:MAG TPA: M48 family metallopeptidase [Usitatibacter sp.]|nr:M48 family metallopeptidase [Usitatibacter sp.]